MRKPMNPTEKYKGYTVQFNETTDEWEAVVDADPTTEITNTSKRLLKQAIDRRANLTYRITAWHQRYGGEYEPVTITTPGVHRSRVSRGQYSNSLEGNNSLFADNEQNAHTIAQIRRIGQDAKRLQAEIENLEDKLVPIAKDPKFANALKELG
jgi:hypothetical protein